MTSTYAVQRAVLQVTHGKKLLVMDCESGELISSCDISGVSNSTPFMLCTSDVLDRQPTSSSPPPSPSLVPSLGNDQAMLSVPCEKPTQSCVKPETLPLDSRSSAYICSRKTRCGDVFVVATVDGKVLILEFWGNHWSQLAEFFLPGNVFGSPVAVGTSLLVGCRDDYLYCLTST